MERFQHPLIAVPKMSAFSLLLYRNWNSATYSGIYLRLILWNVPTTPRLKIDQKPSIVCIWIAPMTYWVIPIERIVAGILIGAKQADFVGDGFADERGESGGIHVRDYTRDNIPLAADSADDRCFAGTDAASSTAAAAFIPMPVLRQAADESFIDFDDTAELVNIFHESCSDLMAHERGYGSGRSGGGRQLRKLRWSGECHLPSCAMRFSLTRQFRRAGLSSRTNRKPQGLVGTGKDA